MADDEKTVGRLFEATQDLFILHALQARANVNAVRKFLHVNKWRVTNISKLLKGGRRATK